MTCKELNEIITKCNSKFVAMDIDETLTLEGTLFPFMVTIEPFNGRNTVVAKGSEEQCAIAALEYVLEYAYR